MSQIKTLSFKKECLTELQTYPQGHNWPVVYLIEGGQEIYVGETTNVFNRSNKHYDSTPSRRLDRIHIISDEEYNKSATLDIESSLIQYIAADGKYTLQNGNQGLRNHNYYDKQKYQAKFEVLWEQLREKEIVFKDLVQIRNSDLFKYSPYKALTEDQFEVVSSIISEINMSVSQTFIVNGGPGTGKTVLATYLIKTLKEFEATKNLEIALVIPMTALRKTLKSVFRGIKDLNASMVIGPNEVVNKKYDILVVDEAHRLKQRKNITNYQSFDKTNEFLGLNDKGTELDWIRMSSEHQIFFYDKNQSVRPSDISPKIFQELYATTYDLKTQVRIGVGDEGEKYINFVQDFFDLRPTNQYKFEKYDFRFYTQIKEMVDEIKKQETKHKLSRMVSGYAWPWESKKDSSKHDIEIENVKLFWNSVNHNWVNSPNAINEVGCIHTVQGYDLNYAGVIIGPELSFDFEKNRFVVYPDKYRDVNGKKGIDDIKELERYIINIYKTLLTRGIKGTYIYIVDHNLRKYFEMTYYQQEKQNSDSLITTLN